MAGDRRISRPDASLPDWEVPDSAYRPIPIVWFTGALIAQMLLLWVVALVFSNQPSYFTIAWAALISGGIGVWTWERGMKTAGNGWKLATIAMLLAQFGFVCLFVSS